MEIAIAGAGIAGLAAAAFLRRQGHKIVVYDKLPTPAAVGSGLIVQPTGQAVLSALGLGEKLVARAARLDRLDGRLADGKRRVLDVRYNALKSGGHGRSMHRAALFELLFSAAIDAGADMEQNKQIISVEHNDVGPMFRFVDGGASPRFDLVIDALGVRSPLVRRKNCFLDYGALWANAPFPMDGGFEENVLAQRYSGAGCSSGIMPMGTLNDGGTPLAAFFWTMRARDFDAWRTEPLDDWKENVLALWPKAASVLDTFSTHDQFVFAHYAHHTLRQSVAGRVVHIGDAWHAASPQLGQGANMALLDAYALARGLEMNRDLGAGLQAFVRMRHTHVQLYQTISWIFTPFYQSDSKLLPWLRDLLAEPGSRLPPMPRVLAALVAGTLGNPLARLGLAT